jgi:hypothetical protein
MVLSGVATGRRAKTDLLVDDAGHDAGSPTITDRLVAATDRCRP